MKNFLSVVVGLFVLTPLTGCIDACSKWLPDIKDPCDWRDPNPWPWRSDKEGRWGEDPRLIPDFGYPQERRAPKMPDADRYLRDLRPAQGQALTAGLLICHVEINSRVNRVPSWPEEPGMEAPDPNRPLCKENWDSIAPDVLLRFRFRDEYPISLFGPEDHNRFFISIPRVRLSVGDQLVVKLWDRDSSFSESVGEFMGEAHLRFDGTLPFTLRSTFFTLECNGMEVDQALARAKWWLEKLDAELERGLSWQPDPDSWNFDKDSFPSRPRSDFFSGNFRYPAGFLGWEHPEIQMRLKRHYESLKLAKAKCHDLVGKLADRAPPALGTHLLNDTLGTVQITSVDCQDKHCTEAQLQPGVALFQALCKTTGERKQVSISTIDEHGGFSRVKVELQSEGKWQDCHAATPPGQVNAVRLLFTNEPVLLQIKIGSQKAVNLRLW